MPSVHSTRRPVRTGVHVLFALSVAIGVQSINAAAAEDTSVSSSTSQKFVKFSGSGSSVLVPHSDSPRGCLAAGKAVCSGKFVGTTTSTLYPGNDHTSGTFTLDYTKPQASAAGVCFPEVVIGNSHTSRGDYRFVQQGQLCIPPALAGLGPGFNVQLRAGLDVGGTGAFAHYLASSSITNTVSPSGLDIFRYDGVASGVEAGGE